MNNQGRGPSSLRINMNPQKEKMVGREGFEPTTIGLIDSCLIYQVFINQSLTVFVDLLCARKRK